MLKVSANYKMNDHFIGVDYSNGKDITIITVQEKDGTVIFSGSPQQLRAVMLAGMEFLQDVPEVS